VDMMAVISMALMYYNFILSGRSYCALSKLTSCLTHWLQGM